MPKLYKLGRAALIGFGLGLIVTAATAFAVLAADNGGPRVDEIVAPKADAWTGPSIAIGAGWAIGSVDFGGVSDLSQSGPTVSGVLSYDKQWGSLVAGAGLGYTHFFGDLASLGVNHDIFGYARMGLLANSNTLVYGHLGYGRLDTDIASFNAFRFGPGIELRLPASPFGLDFRWTHSVYDLDKLGSGLNALKANSDEVTGRLVYHFPQ